MYRFFNSNSNNVVGAVAKFCKCLEVKVSISTLKSKLQSHPRYPSLLCVSDCLSEIGISNNAYKIDIPSFDVNDIDFPFIAHIPENGGRYIVVNKIFENTVYFADERSDKKSYSLEEFLGKWQGIALHGIPNAKNVDNDYGRDRVKEILQLLTIPTLVLIIISLFYFNFKNQTLNLNIVLLSLLKLGGVSVTTLLLIQSINKHNSFLENLCSLGGVNSHCDTILNSKEAQLFKWLSWSEVGFFYFAGSFISILWLPSLITILAYLNLIALPFIVYSIGYQFKKKSWCVLCCAVQVVLLFEFLTNLSGNVFNVEISLGYNQLIALEISFIIPVVSWIFLKPFFVRSAEFYSIKQQLNNFKFNTNLFLNSLESQQQYSVPEELQPILIGNRSAETTVTIVSNPFCGPCAEAHKIIGEWLNLKDNILIKIIFIPARLEDDKKAIVIRHFYSLYKEKCESDFEVALNAWFSVKEKKYEEWAKSYPLISSYDFSEIEEAQRKWCKLVDIQYTPTILINGYPLQSPYKLEDLKYLI